eukprot:CAMPEP_0197050198 /NCGR_PEP_ID=MMETSP1384-20130603/25144_1 /TAXON_ID=29189 /ORGANISM="Ammonia sp." /LENGTH=861 /DNA_ID=CAMNT_0042482569 /DNA_START=1 /DNA_END=2586 /DNA_ORIENTATION=+
MATAFPPHQATTSMPVMGSEMRQLAEQMNGGQRALQNNANSQDVLAQLSSIFDVLDLDGNGDLDLPEFRVGLNSIGINLTHDETNTLFESIDTENESYINKESFLEWLGKDHSGSPEINQIRVKLAAALNMAQEIDNPIQDLMDDDEVDALLGGNPEYLKEMNRITKANESKHHGDPDHDEESDGTTKINQDSDVEEDFDDDEPASDDSLSSEERAEIKRRKKESLRNLERTNSKNSNKKQHKKNSKKKVMDETEEQQPANTDNLESRLMEEEMQKMQQARLFQLNREVSGRHNFKMEDATQWDLDEMDHAINEMKEHHRRLTEGSLSVDQAVDTVLQTMQEIRKTSTTTPVPPDDLDATMAQIHAAFPDTMLAVPDSQKRSDRTDTQETVAPPQQIGTDEYDTTVMDAERPTLNNKQLPPKTQDELDDVVDVALQTSLSANGGANVQGKHKEKSNNIAVKVQPAASAPNSSSSSKPVQEITSSGTPHTTSSQPVMISSGSANSSRRNSYSYSYSQHSQHSYVNPYQSAASNPNNAAYVMPPSHNGQNGGMTDISVFTATQPMQQQLINGNEHGNHIGHVHDKHAAHHDRNCGGAVVGLFRWYLAPMHSKETLYRLWYHGANAVLSTAICFVMLSLFILALLFIPLCGIGLIFIYWQCLLARHFAVIDSTFSSYFFGDKIFPRFSIFIPKSHEQSIIGALKEYITDPHMLEVILYFTLIKLPAAFILSGISMAIFSGVTAILLSPLIYWLWPAYFRHDLYCLFGTATIVDGTVNCSGWPINEFSDTFAAFLAFIGTLPLTLHLSNFAAKLLCRIAFNFLSITTSNANSNHHQNINGPDQLQQTNGYNMNTFNAPPSGNAAY